MFLQSQIFNAQHVSVYYYYYEVIQCVGVYETILYVVIRNLKVMPKQIVSASWSWRWAEC